MIAPVQSANTSLPPQGAYVALGELIALRLAARQLSLQRRKRALSQLAGPNSTNFRGRGLDFEEVRSYQSGDDIRSIDWRVTARTGDAHIKMFREERERPVLIVVDQRNSMFFGSTHCFKSVLAAHLGGLLAWSALHGGDRVGGLVFTDAAHREIRPKRSRKQVLALLSEIEAHNHALPGAVMDTGSTFADMLANLRRIARPGASIFLVSDFRAAHTASAREQWFELAKHTEITALSCDDPLESELPREGRYTVTNGRQRSQLDTGDRALRERFSTQFRTQRAALAQHLLRLGIPLLEARTDTAPLALLQTYYGARRR